MTAPNFPKLDPATGRILDTDQPQPISGGQMMGRRQASKLILTGSLAAPALIRPGAALASNRDEENEGLATSGQILLRLAAGVVLLHSFYLLSATQWWGINLQGDHRQFNEKRTRLGGFLGRLTRPTMATRLQDAVILGQLFMLGNSLFFFTENPRMNWAQKLLIAHRFISWEPRRRLQRVSGSNLSSTRIRQQAVQVGFLAFTSLFLMLLINPILNRNLRFG